MVLTTPCNDLFSRFEQQILFLQKQAETTEPTMDRHGHDGPSRGSRSKHLEFWNLGTEIDSLNFMTEWQDGPSFAWRTVTNLSTELTLWTLWQACSTDRHSHDGPSQAA